MRFPHSIRWRLQVWHGLILLCVLGGFGLTAWRLQQQRMLRTVEDRVHERYMHVLRLLREADPHERQGRPRAALHRPGGMREENAAGGGSRELQTMLQDINGPNEVIQVWWRDGTLQTPLASGAMPAMPQDADIQPHITRSGNVLELLASTPPGEVVRVVRDISKEMADLRRTAWQLAAAGAGVLGLGLAGGWWAAGRSLRPIATMSATAERLSAGNLGERIQVPDSGDELGRLAATLNAMLGRLDVSFARQTRFISDAAHELRTPVTVMLTQTQTALRRERTAEEYRLSLEACQRAADRMRQLIESLLALARLDAGDQPMKRLRFDLGRAATEQMELLAPLAAARGISMTGDIHPLPMEGDPDYLTLVIANLLTNAIHYNRDGGSVRLSLHQEGGQAVLSVSDTGMGMDEATLTRIFDRFYRADQSRSLPAGRTGLGLAITKSIVEAHRGSITVESAPENGTTFTVRVPLAGSE